MPQLTILPLDPPTGRHSRREQALADAWSADELAGRTVWCAASMQTLQSAAASLQEHMLQAGVDAGSLDDRSDATVVGATVSADDVVVLSDLTAAQLALVAREHGAHVVWHVDVAVVRPRQAQALDRFVRATDASADSYVMSWSQPLGRGRLVERIVTLLPHADVVAAVQLPVDGPGEGRRLAWSCALAEAVHADRTEHVGGRVHARPSVAAR
ncbi:MAG: hypothetical protein JWO02_2841 [Solirubrobacterales bacterium]|nr:hypothetical protein [Solirubrobacterales bacterium]